MPRLALGPPRRAAPPALARPPVALLVPVAPAVVVFAVLVAATASVPLVAASVVVGAVPRAALAPVPGVAGSVRGLFCVGFGVVRALLKKCGLQGDQRRAVVLWEEWLRALTP